MAHAQTLVSNAAGLSSRAGDIANSHAKAVLAGIVVLATALRVFKLGDRSLWLDEILTVFHSRRPWPQVLGLQGWYVEGPPLYYVIVKATSLVVPEAYAGRVVSVVAGIATVVVVWALARELVDGRAGLIAAFLLAFAPLHIWYSQEARQYALVILFVSVAYLALFKLLRTGERRWLAAYAAALALAMYTDYSALYALVWQPLIVIAAYRRDRHRALLSAFGIALAAVAYLPWLPQVIDTVHAIGTVRTFLDVDKTILTDATVAIAGLHGNGAFYAPGPMATAWTHPLFRPILEASALVAVTTGLFALAKRSIEALLAGVSLLFGTLLMAVAVTILVSPGFADRTVLAATVGWAVVCAAAATYGLHLLGNEVSWRRLGGAVAVASVALLAAGAALTTAAMITAADKQHWRDQAFDVGRVAQLGYPIVLYPGAVMYTQVDMYQPGRVVGTSLAIDGDRSITATDVRGPTGVLPEAVWFAYFPFTQTSDRQHELESLGYRQISHRYYWNELFLDLYAMPGKPVGDPVDLPEITDASPAQIDVAADSALYVLDASVSLPTGAELDPGSVLSCLAPDGSPTDMSPRDSLRKLLVGNGDAADQSFAVLCPEGTSRLLIDFQPGRDRGASFRDVHLMRIALD